MDKIEEAKKMIDEVIDKYKIFEGEFESVTYYWGGDYEGKTFGEKNRQIVTRVSENEIVGKLRWFLRTVLARFVAKNLDNYKEVDECLYFLGTTYDKALKSDYLFRVEIIDHGREIHNKDLESLSRVKLSLMGEEKGKKNQFLPIDGVKFELEIYRLKKSLLKGGQKEECINPDKRDFLVIGGVLLTLAYLGIGKGANRGFGRFYPKPSKNEYMSEDIKKIRDEILSGHIKSVFALYYSGLGFNEEGGKKRDWRKSKIPLAPLTSASIEDGGIDVCDCDQGVDEFEALLCCNKATIKSTWKAYWKGNINLPGKYLTDPGLKIHTWIFGLPRDAGKRTGYLLDNNVRRISPVVLSPIKISNKEYKVAILPFLSSKDFEEVINKGLKHRGIHKPNKVHEVKVSSIINSNEINKVLWKGEEQAPPQNQKFVTGSIPSLIENYIKELHNVISKVCESSFKPSTVKGTGGQRRY